MNFFLKYKKIFIIIGFVLAVLILGWLIFSLFFKPNRPNIIDEQPTATTTGGGGLPQSQTGGGQTQLTGQSSAGLTTGGGLTQANQIANGGLTQITQLTQNASLGATLDADGNNLLYYNKEDGKFYRLSKEGQVTALTDTVFHEVQKITWSPDKSKAILEYPDQAKIIYDFNNNQQISLPNHWKDFDFSPNGGKIVMKSMANDENNRWLAIMNDDGTSARRIASLGDKDETVYPSWSPNNQIVAMYTEGENFDQQKVYFVGLNEENFKSLTIDGRGFDFQWSPSGANLLYSVYSSDSDLKPELWITTAQGDNIGASRLKLSVQTWADKCVFASSSELYCAVPESLEEGAGLFPELAADIKDNLYKINTATGQKKLIAVPDGQYTMSDLSVSDNGYYLYFTDAASGTINQVKLK